LPGASGIAKNANGKKRGQPDHAINNNENESPPSAKKQKQSPTANSGKKVDDKKTDIKKDSSKDKPSLEDLSAIKSPFSTPAMTSAKRSTNTTTASPTPPKPPLPAH